MGMRRLDRDGADTILCHYRKLGDVIELRGKYVGSAERVWLCYRARYEWEPFNDEVVILRKYGEDDFTTVKYDHLPKKYNDVVFWFELFYRNE